MSSPFTTKRCTKRDLNRIQRYLDRGSPFHEEYVRFHHLSYQILQAERCYALDPSSKNLIHLETLNAEFIRQFPVTCEADGDKYAAMTRRWSAHTAFHTKEMGLEWLHPFTDYGDGVLQVNQMYLQQGALQNYGTPEEVLGPAARYHPECL